MNEIAKVRRDTLLNHLAELLQVAKYKDYAPNGLQVEGRDSISRLVSGVTASQALIDKAIELEADAILVHHGYFWRGEDPCVVGMKRQRLQCLLANNINLLAYHLPLDGHPELGNNAQLARVLGWSMESGLNPQDPWQVGNLGRLPEPMTASELVADVSNRLGRPALLVAGGDHPISRVAWCTGGAQGYIEQAAAQGVDAYLSGEISEQTTHVARELGIHYIAAGHHATERYGAQALGQYLADRYQLFHQFIDVENPA